MRTLACFLTLLALAIAVEPAAAAFPGRNGKLAFASNRSGNFDIWVVRPNGAGETRLTSDPAVDSQPAWSPDGTWIAFASQRDGNFELYAMAANGSGQVRLTQDPADDVEPAWSPDGAAIAFSSRRSGNQDVWLMSADGTNLRNLTPQNTAADQQPAWSPDGTRIVFSSLRPDLVSEGCRSEIYSMASDGSDLVRLTNDALCQFSPAWSPDGQRIAYVIELEPDPTIDELWVMNADGSGQSKIVGGLDPASDVSWSPDGTRIAFTSYSGGRREVSTVAPDGSNATEVTASLAIDLQADWQRAPSDPWERAASQLEMPVLRPGKTPGLRLDRVVPRTIECGAIEEELDAYYAGPGGKRLRVAEGSPSYCANIGDAPLLAHVGVRGKAASLYDYCEGRGCKQAAHTYLLTWRELGVQVVLISRGLPRRTLVAVARSMREVEEVEPAPA